MQSEPKKRKTGHDWAQKERHDMDKVNALSAEVEELSISQPSKEDLSRKILEISSELSILEKQARHPSVMNAIAQEKEQLDKLRHRAVDIDSVRMSVISATQWVKRGMEIASSGRFRSTVGYNRSSIPIEFLYGPLEVEIKVREQRRTVKDKEEAAKSTMNVIPESEEKDQSTHDRMRILKNRLKEHQRLSLPSLVAENDFECSIWDLDHFVALTVENLFAASMLVRGGFVSFYPNENGETPFFELKAQFIQQGKKKTLQAPRDQGQRKACIMTLSTKNHRGILKAAKDEGLRRDLR